MIWAVKQRVAEGAAFIDVGRGPVVVALHGGLSSSTDTFRRIGPALAEHHRFIAPDLAGHCDSQTDVDTLTHDVMADEVESVLRHLGISGPYHLLGFSLGAAVAMVLALRMPERIVSLTLAGANTMPTAVTRRGADSVLPEVIVAERPRLAAALERLHGGDWSRLAARLSSLWRVAPIIGPTQLEEFQALLLIVGDRDPFTHLEQQRAILDVCPAASLLVVPNCDHHVFASDEHARFAVRAIESVALRHSRDS